MSYQVKDRELFPDTERLELCEPPIVLHKPVDRGTVMQLDAPWEGWGCGFMYVIPDNGRIRMFYGCAGNTDTTGKLFEQGIRAPHYACVIESEDGIHWTRPNVGVFEFNGSRDNNIIMDKFALSGYTDHEAFEKSGKMSDNFCVFLDENPECPPDERYKAIEGSWKALHVYVSADGLHWRLGNDGKTIDVDGTFDCGNIPLWDAETGLYHLYFRGFHNVPGDNYNSGIRDIRHATSKDFKVWNDLGLLDFGDEPDIPLYTSTITRCPGAPRFTIGFPVRYFERLEWSPTYDQLPNRPHRLERMKLHPRIGLALTDCLFMSSRDGHRFNRSKTAYFTPGPVADNNWVYGDVYFSAGLAKTKADRPGAPDELSIYMLDNHFQGQKILHRYAIRQEGFASLSFGATPQTALTKPFTHTGEKLTLNFASAAVTDGRVEICGADGKPLPGYSAADCDSIFGDFVSYTVTWNGSSALPDTKDPISLRFIFNDCELFSYGFE